MKEDARRLARRGLTMVLVGTLPTSVLIGAPVDPGNPLGLSLHHVTALVSDLENESRWYQHVLGFHEVNRFDNGEDFAMRLLTLPGCRIDLVWRRQATKRISDGTGAVQGWLHVVYQTHDIEAALRRLTALGTNVKVDKNDKKLIDHLTLHDPEGNEIGISAE